MSVLRSLEDKIAGLVEGAFGRVFRAEVRPVEIARKLAREMDEHRSTSVSRTYVPTEYAVYVSPKDRQRFASFEDSLAGELAGYLLEHARRERLSLVSRPRVSFRTDVRLGLGEFGIQVGAAQGASAAEPGVQAEAPAASTPAATPDAGRTMVYSTAERLRRPLEEARAATSPPLRGALLVNEGRRLPVTGDVATVGRSRECDIVLADQNVSRRHAELRRAGQGWEIIDLGSTNGIKLNGERIVGPRSLSPGDELVLGTTKLTFELD